VLFQVDGMATAFVDAGCVVSENFSGDLEFFGGCGVTFQAQAPIFGLLPEFGESEFGFQHLQLDPGNHGVSLLLSPIKKTGLEAGWFDKLARQREAEVLLLKINEDRDC
jgi:hypothetical protein